MPSVVVHVVTGIAIMALAIANASAQERPFFFSLTTTTDHEQSALHVEYDVGAGESVFHAGTSNQPEQRVALQASWRRLTMVGRVGMVTSGSAYQSTQSGEALVSLLDPSRAMLSIGGGVLHEAGGVNVLLARLVGGKDAERWRMAGNLIFQKPLSGERDAVDLITTFGWSRRLTPAVSLGVETVAEDLEGFWDPLEAEGGARILVGPSLHVSPPGRKWQVTATGGPSFHPNDTGRSSGAVRDLPQSRGGVGYAVKAALAYRFH